jgi:hypothetical protein
MIKTKTKSKTEQEIIIKKNQDSENLIRALQAEVTAAQTEALLTRDELTKLRRAISSKHAATVQQQQQWAKEEREQYVSAATAATAVPTTEERTYALNEYMHDRVSNTDTGTDTGSA